MEKKRRARINDSLETLKQILLDSKTTLKGSTNRSGQKTAKLEKADILEMTVCYLQHLHRKLEQINNNPVTEVKRKEHIAVQAADSTCERIKVTLVPTRIENGELVFMVPSQTMQEHLKVETENVWRPW